MNFAEARIGARLLKPERERLISVEHGRRELLPGTHNIAGNIVAIRPRRSGIVKQVSAGDGYLYQLGRFASLAQLFLQELLTSRLLGCRISYLEPGPVLSSHSPGDREY
jgi:hypothetical protein